MSGNSDDKVIHGVGLFVIAVVGGVRSVDGTRVCMPVELFEKKCAVE